MTTGWLCAALYGFAVSQVAAHVVLRHSHQNHNHSQKQSTGSLRARPQATVSFGLRQQVTQCRAKRAGQDVANPEGQHRVTAQPPNQISQCNQSAEYHCSPSKAQIQGLCR